MSNGRSVLQSTGKYSNYFIITLNGSLIYRNIGSVCCIPENNIVNQLYGNKK